MLKWLGIIPIFIALLGTIYGGLIVLRDVQTAIESSVHMAEDAHKRIDDIYGDIDKVEMDIENEFMVERGKLEREIEKEGFKVDEVERELVQLTKVLSMTEGKLQALESKSFSFVTMDYLEAFRQTLDKLRMETEMYTTRFNDLEMRLRGLESGNWN